MWRIRRNSLLLFLLLAGWPWGSQAQAPPQVTTPEPLADIWPLPGDPHTGDLDEILKHEVIRVLTPFAPGVYFIDKGRPRGFVYEMNELFQKFARDKLNRDVESLHVALLPVQRDQVIQLLVAGHGDLAFTNLTVTPERLELVDFSNPMLSDVSEILITGPHSPLVNNLGDLSGQEVATRKGTSYHESLLSLNARFESEGKAQVQITLLPATLDDYDLLDMVAAGILPMMVMDDYKAKTIDKTFPSLIVRDDIVLRDDATVALALRKDSPKLKALVNEFLSKYRFGTLIPNVLRQRYLGASRWGSMEADDDLFHGREALWKLFVRYGEQYRIDPLILASFAYQESKFDNNVRSHVGAVGIMQVMPKTAADPVVNIPDISSPENNVHAGTKYLAWLRDTYFDDLADAPAEQMYFTMAGYNAGPTRINRLRKEAAARGRDPDVWFENVEELVAAEVGVEPIVYVANIYRYYIAYRRAFSEHEARLESRQEVLEAESDER